MVIKKNRLEIIVKTRINGRKMASIHPWPNSSSQMEESCRASGSRNRSSYYSGQRQAISSNDAAIMFHFEATALFLLAERQWSTPVTSDDLLVLRS